MTKALTKREPQDAIAGVEQSERQALVAVEAIERVDSPDQAEALLRQITAYQQAVRLAKIGHEQERRWGAIRLQAERKMGELLGPAEAQPGPGRGKTVDADNRLSQEEKDARVKARRVAAVPEPAFTAYIEKAETPTRAGLLREAKAEREDEAPEPARRKPSSKADEQLMDCLSQIEKLIPKWNPSFVDPHRPAACRRRVATAEAVSAFLVSFIEAHAPKVESIPTAPRG